jgi:hypothetical protein
MFFILIDEQRRQNALNYIKAVNIGKPLCIEVKEYKKNRSGAQNRMMWNWYGAMAQSTGYSTDELHEEMKVRFLGVENRTRGGVDLVVPKESKNLSTKEFSDFLNKIEMVAAQMGIILPIPDDYSEIMGKAA